MEWLTSIIDILFSGTCVKYQSPCSGNREHIWGASKVVIHFVIDREGSSSVLDTGMMDTEPCCTSTFIIPMFKVYLAIINRIILGMGSVNERRCYNVTSAFIGWVPTHNPCIRLPMCESYHQADHEQVMVVTKSPLANFSVSKSFDLAKLSLSIWTAATPVKYERDIE